MTAMNTLTKNDCGNSTFAPHRGMYSALDAKEDENMACKWGEKKEHDNFAGGQPCFADRRRHLRFAFTKGSTPVFAHRGLFFSGMGGSFTAISLVVLARRRLIGEARAKKM